MDHGAAGKARQGGDATNEADIGGSHHVTSLGATIWYRHVPGYGPTCVFLHGLGGNSAPMRRLAAPFEEIGRSTLMLDMRGHGMSEAPDTSAFSLLEYAQDILDVIDQLGIECADLVGHCMGGMVALKVRELRPALVRNMVLISTTSHTAKSTRSRTIRAAARLTDSVVPAVAPRWYRKRILAQPDPCTFPRHPDIYLPRLRADVANTSLRVMVRSLMELLSADVRSAAVSLDQGALVVHGRRDHIIPESAALETHGLIEGSRLVLLENDGHVSHVLGDVGPLSADLGEFLGLDSDLANTTTIGG